MADPTIPNDDDSDKHVCPDCGAPLDDQEIFDACMNSVVDAMMATTDDDMEMALLGSAAALFLSNFDAHSRKRVRRDLIRLIDENTKEFVINACDA